MTSSTAGLRPRRARTTTYAKGASPVIVPVLLGPNGSPIVDDFETTGSQNVTSRTGWQGVTMVGADTTMTTDVAPHNIVGGPAQSNTYGPFISWDSEAWVQVAAFRQSLDDFYVCTRVSVVGASFTNYAVEVSTTNRWRCVRWVGGAGTVLGSDLTQVVVEGDSVAVSAIGSNVRTWYQANGAGSWTLKHNVTDTNITAAGAIGGIIARAGAGRTVSFMSLGAADFSAHHYISNTRRVWAGRS